MSFQDCLAHWVVLSLTRSLACSRHASQKESKSTPSFLGLFLLFSHIFQSLALDQLELLHELKEPSPGVEEEEKIEINDTKWMYVDRFILRSWLGLCTVDEMRI